MTLAELGFDEWFQKEYAGPHESGFAPARVTRVDRERYRIRGEGTEVPAELTGKLLFSSESVLDLPCVGDWVLVQYHNDGELAIIHGVFPRRTMLRRKAPGQKVDYQPIASNIDVAFIMQSCDIDFNIRRIERYLITVADGRIAPLILLSKTDLTDAQGVQERLSVFRDAGIRARTIPFSNRTGIGLDAIRAELAQGRTYCLLGSSGVGKTTLLNTLLGHESFETAPVRAGDGRGKHTTAQRQLTVLENGALLIDTPGMRELGMIAEDASVDEVFSDIRELSARCHFADCTHTVELGCAVLEEVSGGRLSEERYRSYLKLMKESRYHRMTYAEKRRKEKEFGKMVNAALKQLQKRKPR